MLEFDVEETPTEDFRVWLSVVNPNKNVGESLDAALRTLRAPTTPTSEWPAESVQECCRFRLPVTWGMLQRRLVFAGLRGPGHRGANMPTWYLGRIAQTTRKSDGAPRLVFHPAEGSG